MKNLKKLFLVIFLTIPFLTNGCYTVLWTPDEDFPDESNYEYYDSYYIEEYHYYYDYPWWLSFTPSYKYRTDDESYERDDDIRKIRDNGNGRGNSDTRNEIINTPPPTRNYTPSDNGSDNSGSSNDTRTETKRTESVNSNNSNNSRQDSNSNNSSVRNNDGNRNNGRGR